MTGSEPAQTNGSPAGDNGGATDGRESACGLISPLHTTTEPQKTQGPDAARHFLTALGYALDHPDGLEFRFLADGKPPRPFWPTPGRPFWPEIVSAQKEGRNVYVGVCPRRDRRGNKEHTTHAPALWADLDGKSFDAADPQHGKAMALARLRQALPQELQPSLLVDSGNGYHGYWLLIEPWDFSENGNRPKLEASVSALAEYLGGDVAVADVARVMRLPGTLNVKDPANPRPCLLVECNPERRFNLSDFDDYFTPDAATQQAPPPPTTPPSDRIPDGERNSTLTRKAGAMRRQAMTPAAILAALREENAARCDPPLSDAEVQTIVRSVSRYKPVLDRPLGVRLPKEEAATIAQLAPQPPAPALRASILTTLLGTDTTTKAPMIVRREQAGQQLLAWLGEHGGFVQGDDGALFYFYRPERRLYDLTSERWAAWLYAVTGANPAGTDYAYFVADCKAAALAAPRRPILRVSAWDPAAQVLRVSRFDGTVYQLDGQTITEEANGEHVLFNDPAACRPYLPDYGQPGALRWLTTNLPNWTAPGGDDHREAHGLALRAWLLATFFSELCPTKPLLVLLGEKGSGKSMTLRLILRLLVGPDGEISGVPDKPDGFTAAAAAAHVLVLDNLDEFTPWLRDKLARLSTGAVDEYRRLYTSMELGTVRYRCWLAFTARTPDTLRRDDLADRLLLLPVERITTGLRAEREFLAEAEGNRNGWWGDVLTALNGMVGDIRAGKLQETSSLRLADWESLGRLLADREGLTDTWDGFVASLKVSQSDFLLEGDLIVEGIDGWLTNTANPGREIGTKDLYLELGALLFCDKKAPGDWPKTARGFGMRLANIRRDLQTRYYLKHYIARGRRDVYQFWPLEATRT